MPPIVRRLVVALLVTALSSQLAQAQLLRCDRMDMRGAATMQSMVGGASEKHDVIIVTSGSEQNFGHQMPASSNCLVSATCLIGPAIPTVFSSLLGTSPDSRLVASPSPSPATLALRPESPPPRF